MLFTKVAIKSFGCRTNQEEMNSLRFRLLQQGVEIVDDIEDAQVIIINTCTVTSSTESKTKRLIKAVAGQNPSAKILLTGCLAQQKPSELKDLDSVFWVVGNTEKDQIPSILEKNGGVFQHPFSREIPNLSIKTNEIPSVKDHAGFRTRFPLKIQEGCNYRCSYCIVPSVRGPSRSAEFSNVLSAFDSALKAGFKEIVLTGTHIGQFAKEQSASLLELLKEIVSFDGDFRVRLSSLDPRDLSDEILQLVGNNSKICDHLHISVQSFSENVLRAMDRPYSDVERLVSRLSAFRRSFPSAGLGADFIVGFPGETDKDFELTMERVSMVGFSYAHIFRFSARPGTSAISLPEQISDSVKTNRSNRLRMLINQSRDDFINKNLTVSKKIIVESESPVRGLTSNYIHVEIPGLRRSCNSWMDVKVHEAVNGRFHLAQPVWEKT
ncbi:MAG: tRNA (N(6)-L-threonylcarbamoyladenosine(37)-C(2))-methylthiotransferase MtaB [Fibrobacter sp.]|jgi:threonylcarbamoyladenosine tRNA methylthiotransferase MtaB|nr:tRNA (N(6)-L-threonylcarbamoyladenosine(37)-C(2))-methylthiotransferase MtaB [Fibrobacter sp.]